MDDCTEETLYQGFITHVAVNMIAYYKVKTL